MMVQINNPEKIYLVELTHTYITVDAKNSPLAIGYLASYAKKHLAEKIIIDLFKYPTDLVNAFESTQPRLIAFSNYMWNENLTYLFAQRIKELNPDILIVFGGPNYPVDDEEKKQLLEMHPEVDFYVDGEGELAFCHLLQTALANNFNLTATKNQLGRFPGINYFLQGQSVLNGYAQRISNIEENIPSPYLTGVLDKFFDKNLTPLLQTSRGCPYACTFCHDGAKYANKTYKYSQQRIKEELLYVAKRSQVPSLTLADLNWGIFPQDIAVAKEIKKIKDKYGWPLNIQTATAKNQKDRIIEMSEILGNSMIVGASIQSSDDVVLKNIKRKNISTDTIVKMAANSAKNQATTFTEIIIGLPGDSKVKHLKSVYDMLDAGIQNINLYQFILLPGTEDANAESRKKYQYQTAFRVIPRCLGIYDVMGVGKSISEIHEVVIGNSTMPHADYLECRRFSLTVMIFNNGEILDELYKSVVHLKLSRAEIISLIHTNATKSSHLKDIYDAFIEDEEINFWPNKKDLEKYLFQNNGLSKYISGKRGRNQLHHWRSVAVFERLDQVVKCATDSVEELLLGKNRLDDELRQYFCDLGKLILLKKGKLTEIQEDRIFTTSFDFSLLEHSFKIGKLIEQKNSKKHQFSLGYTPERLKVISSYFEQYGADLRGLSHLTHRYPAQIFYRDLVKIK